MSHQHENISPELAEWIGRQRLFFVATAPLDIAGHINCSPKGGDAFRVLGPLEVAYQDYTGSGAETSAHLRENGRIIVMFCAFEGPPKILRLHGRGKVLEANNPEFDALAAVFPVNPGTRAIVRIAVDRVSDSCGFAVPFYDFKAPREALDKWAVKKGPAGLREYRNSKNQKSIDGIPAFTEGG
ncbi:MAG TPA: pyridoxamine 5'-phosphate oxidase family protein [Planctomycetota bacterium]|jgi:hypothetical protein|nr:pyridoxamine 5'-phosphate oxidase family protein [Planctomycetota bacterium]